MICSGFPWSLLNIAKKRHKSDLPNESDLFALDPPDNLAPMCFQDHTGYYCHRNWWCWKIFCSWCWNLLLILFFLIVVIFLWVLHFWEFPNIIPLQMYHLIFNKREWTHVSWLDTQKSQLIKSWFPPSEFVLPGKKHLEVQKLWKNASLQT